MAMIHMTNVIISITSELSQRILAMLDILTASSSLSFSWTCACSVVQYEIQKIQSNNTKHQSKISICHLWVQSEVIEIPRHCSYLEKTGFWAKTFGNIIVCENLWWSWCSYENDDGTGGGNHKNITAYQRYTNRSRNLTSTAWVAKPNCGLDQWEHMCHCTA